MLVPETRYVVANSIILNLLLAAARVPSIFTNNDGVLYIGSNDTDTQVRIAGVDVLQQMSQLMQRVSALEQESSSQKAQILHISRMRRRFKESYKLVASDGANGDWFGASVSVDDELFVVGAERNDNQGTDDSGSVYVFTKTQSGLDSVFREVNHLTASDGKADDHFGSSVCVLGNFLFVGAPGDDDHGTDSGSVYVFEKVGLFEERYKLVPATSTNYAYFGSSISAEHNLLFVGAIGDHTKGDMSGSVYVFETIDGGNLFLEKYKITASDGASYDNFGISVAVHDNLLAVGAYGADDQGSASGCVYIFQRKDSSGMFEENHKITASDGVADDNFGSSVAVSGYLLVVGAHRDDDKGEDSGSVYVYEKNLVSGIFEESYKITASDGTSGDVFGSSVSLTGDLLVVGAELDDDKGEKSGSVYVFTLST